MPVLRVSAAPPGRVRGDAAQVAKVVGWAFVAWGTALYWCAAGLYLIQARRLTLVAVRWPNRDNRMANQVATLASREPPVMMEARLL